MIITLIGADFSESNIGTLSSWIISRVLGDGATYAGPSYVDKDAALSATVTLDEGYEIGSAGITITMGGTTLDESYYSVVDNVITFTIASVTGSVVIKVPTLNTNTGEEDVIPNYIFTINPTPTNATVTLSATGYSTVSGTGSKSITVANGTKVNWRVEASGYTTRTGSWTISNGNKTENITLATSGEETITGTLPLVQYALSVVSGENFYQVGSKNTKRLSTSSITDATGIWIDAGATITLTGTSGLRFDYVYATKQGPNSNDKSVNTIGGVGTASNFATSNFFPLNADGSSNTISITNDNGTGYYYFFAIAAPNKTDEILVANYQGKITYIITPANDTPSGDVISSGTLFLQNGALSVVNGENFFVSLNSETSKTKRMNSSSLTEATGILVPNGKTITLTGTRGLRFDYIYATKPGPNSSTDKTSNVIGGVGTASNFVSSNYFPLNADGSSNTISITNNYGQDYYYHFAIAGPTKSEVLNPDDYNITYVVS
jgi:hypothetical protein